MGIREFSRRRCYLANGAEGRRQKVAGLGWFLAGDAAVVLDPSSSHGVLRAIMTGMMAGHLVSQQTFNNAPTALCARSYQRWLAEWTTMWRK